MRKHKSCSTYQLKSIEKYMPNRILNLMRAKHYKQTTPDLITLATGHDLNWHLDYSNKEDIAYATDEPIDLGYGYTVEVELINDYDKDFQEEFGTVKASEFRPSPDWVYAYSGDRRGESVWILPEYSIAERAETLHSYGVSKADTRLIATRWAEQQSAQLRKINDGRYFYFGYVAKTFFKGEELGEDSCWGYVYEDKLDPDIASEINSHITYTVNAHKKMMQAANQYAYA